PPAPTSCPCCGSTKLSKIGEDITETLDVVPRQWFVTEHVREKFSCRHCEKITQPPAPFHVIARGFAGPSLLAMILVDKYANHQPLTRSRSAGPPRSSARTRSCCGTWPPTWSRRTAACGSTAPTISRPSPSTEGTGGRCSRSTNLTGQPRGLERMVT